MRSDLRWALVSHPNQVDVDGELMQSPMHIQESSIPTALSQGWFVIAQDSDMQPAPIHGYGAVEDDGA